MGNESVVVGEVTGKSRGAALRTIDEHNEKVYQVSCNLRLIAKFMDSGEFSADEWENAIGEALKGLGSTLAQAYVSINDASASIFAETEEWVEIPVVGRAS